MIRSLITLLSRLLGFLERHEAEKRQDDLNQERKKARDNPVDYANDRWVRDKPSEDVPSQPPSDGAGGDESQRDSQDS